MGAVPRASRASRAHRGPQPGSVHLGQEARGPLVSFSPRLIGGSRPCLFAPSAAVPSLFDGDLGCLFQTGEAFYQSIMTS